MFIKPRSKAYHKIVVSIFILLLILLPAILLAQGPGDPGGPGTPCDVNSGIIGSSQTCPLDTGVWILVVVVAILGAIKLYARKNEQNQYS
ncbi:hypothetical protein [Mucilaginibacter sp. L196]|uniref:hypothetical protein n=1 Tax=Mucilaginibacter sp. L196 TaxID=1641870 RepID=UPI00131C3E48|nr:hypothetical protein [Mucilaginibacter sp. L196]